MLKLIKAQLVLTYEGECETSDLPEGDYYTTPQGYNIPPSLLTDEGIEKAFEGNDEKIIEGAKLFLAKLLSKEFHNDYDQIGQYMGE